MEFVSPAAVARVFPARVARIIIAVVKRVLMDLLYIDFRNDVAIA
jgi:hypothetical protein